MRLEAVVRTVASNKVVNRVWVASIISAGVAMTPEQVFAVWRAPMPPMYGAAASCARIIGTAKNRGDKSTSFKIIDDNPHASTWIEYIEHPDREPLVLPVMSQPVARSPLPGPAFSMPSQGNPMTVSSAIDQTAVFRRPLRADYRSVFSNDDDGPVPTPF